MLCNRVVSSVQTGSWATAGWSRALQSDVFRIKPPEKCSNRFESLTHNIQYRVSNHVSRSQRGALVDRGANGGILGQDARVIHTYKRRVDVTGIDNHEMNGLQMVDAGACIDTNKGPRILVLRQYAYHGIDRTIHSSLQLEHYKNTVDDKSIPAGGRQCITTRVGYTIDRVH